MMYAIAIALVTMVFHVICSEDVNPSNNLWTINLRVADFDNNGMEYFGGMEIDMVFSNFDQLNFTLPLQQYSRGGKYSFQLRLGPCLKLQYANIRTISFCRESMPAEVLRLDWVEFHCALSQTSYLKRMNNAALKDKCQTNRGTGLIDFEENAYEKCEMDGKIYNNGESFEVDCSMRCTCNRGGIGCVDMCPPFTWMRKPNQVCQEINIPGKCCPSMTCVNERGQSVEYSNNTAKSADQNECGFKNFEKLHLKYNFGYPSMAFICDDQCQDEKKFKSAVVLNNKWVAIYGSESFDPSGTFVYVQREFVKRKQFKVEKIVKHETLNLIMVQLADYLPNSLMVQPANLPVDKNHCLNLISEDCRATSPTWKFNGKLPLDSTRGGLLLPVVQITNPSACTSLPSDSAVCLALPKDSCTGAWKNDPIFVSDGDLDFFVGLQSSQDQWNTCQNRQNGNGVNVCSSLDWIRKTIAN